MFNRHTTVVLAMVLAGFVGFCGAVSGQTPEQWEESEIAVEELLSWERRGDGYFGNFRDTALQIIQSEQSDGVMVVSPDSYGEQVSVSYDIMTLRPATVAVIMLSASQEGSDNLQLPPEFNGDLADWPPNTSDYFFAFHNSPHFLNPFVKKSTPEARFQTLKQAEKSFMQPGKWHRVEAGRDGDRLWLEIDGELAFEVTDEEPLGPGHLAFRIVGVGPERGSCLIKNVSIQTPPDSEQAKSADMDGSEGPRTINLDKPLGSEGTVSFKMTVPQTYRVGADSPKKRVPILEIPGLVTYRLHQSESWPFPDPHVIKLAWLWEQEGVGRVFKFVPELPGPATYYVQYTWDAEEGVLDAYVDGNPLRMPGSKQDTWSLEPSAKKIKIPESEIKVSDVEVQHTYLPPWRAQALVPSEHRGRNPEIWGLREDAEPVDVEERKGDLLYTAEMNDSEDIADWKMEGPGKTVIEDGWLRMWSPDQEYHHVFWCPEDFPDSFVAEWDVRIVSEHGLCIVFFAATGPEGQDIFAPEMPERDGNFGQYNKGLNAYHISYYANNPGVPRMCSNLRKDGEFYLMDQGPVGISPNSDEAHHLRLIKDGDHIQLQVDGQVYLDHTDDNPERFGEPYEHGKIGFRQMQWMEALYRNFQVWELEKAE